MIMGLYSQTFQQALNEYYPKGVLFFRMSKTCEYGLVP